MSRPINFLFRYSKTNARALPPTDVTIPSMRAASISSWSNDKNVVVVATASGHFRLRLVLLLWMIVLSTGLSTANPPSLTPGQITDPSGVTERVRLAIDLIETSERDGCGASTRQILDLLYAVVDTASPLHEEIADTNRRRLEDGRDDNDDDDYFSFYSLYSFTKRNSDVSVSYDDEDNTVVTVGDDVIVVVEHSLSHYVLNGSLVLMCILLGATMAGLLMGVMSLDPLILGVKARTAETESERRAALALLPFVQNKNLVLVSVLLVNCGTNEALPIFMDALLENPLLTVLLSLTVVLVVGEILPSAYFTGKDQIRSASQLIPVLRMTIIITSPISYPLAKLMDHYFHHGAEVSSFKRGEVSALVRIQYEEHLAWKRRQAEKLQREEASKDDVSLKSLRTVPSFSKQCDTCRSCNMCEPLGFLNETDLMACMPNDQCMQSSHSGQQNICSDDIIKLEGALSLRDKRVENTYTPMNRVVSVTADAVLDEDMLVRIYSFGYSRVPVFGRDETSGQLSVCGVLLTKQLMLVRKEDKRKVCHLTLYEPPCVSPDATLADTLSTILTGSRKASNLALVCANPALARAHLALRQPVPVEAGVLGIITLEQLLEELIQEQIWDEKDKRADPKFKRAKWAVRKWRAFVSKKKMQRDNLLTSSTSDDDDTSCDPFDYIRMKEMV